MTFSQNIFYFCWQNNSVNGLRLYQTKKSEAKLKLEKCFAYLMLGESIPWMPVKRDRSWLDFRSSHTDVSQKFHYIKKLNFPSRISTVNVTKSAVSFRFGHVYWRNPWRKTWFFCAVFQTNAQENQIAERYSINIFQK